MRTPMAKGFTLMELVIVISVIAILAVTSLYSFSAWKTTTQVSVAGEQFMRLYQVMAASCALNPSTGYTEAEIASRLESGATQVSSALPSLNGGSYAFTAPVNCDPSSIRAATLTTPALSDGTTRTCSGNSADVNSSLPCV
jgi:prepilin-type N-terminal cleavage/methylation domain-containing protein